MKDLDLATYSAFYAAANVVAKLDPALNSLDWPSLFAASDLDREDVLGALGDFCREYDTSAEALWRFANGKGHHGGDPNGFWDAPEHHYMPYAVFHGTLHAVDGAINARRSHRRQVARLTEARAPTPAPEIAGSILEQHGHIDEPSGFAPPAAAPLPPSKRPRR